MNSIDLIKLNKPYSTYNLIIPYCIYHNKIIDTIDNEGVTADNDYYSRIGSPEITVDMDGLNPRYKCMDKSLLYSSWKPYGIFLSLNPMFRPIPKDMILVCAQWNRGEPGNTLNIKHVIDPYDINTDLLNFTGSCIFFYAYSRKVSGTVPLYFHKNLRGVYATFDSKPPIIPNYKWENADIPYIYVIKYDNKDPTSEIHIKDLNNLKFSIIDNTCVVDNKNGKYKNISECILDSHDEKILTLFDMLREDNNKKNIYFKKYIINIPKYFIFISITLITMYIILFFYKKYKHKNIYINIK